MKLRLELAVWQERADGTIDLFRVSFQAIPLKSEKEVENGEPNAVAEAV